MMVDRADFPLLAMQPDLHYLDSAATSQKPRAVLDAMMDYYTHDNANPHRGAYALSARATECYHRARGRIAGDRIHAQARSQLPQTGVDGERPRRRDRHRLGRIRPACSAPSRLSCDDDHDLARAI